MVTASAFTVLLVLEIGALLSSIFLCAWIWRRRGGTLASILFASTIFTIGWVASNITKYIISDAEWGVILFESAHVLHLYTAVCVTLFAVHFTNNDHRLNKLGWGIIFVGSLAFGAFTLTNQFHEIAWTFSEVSTPYQRVVGDPTAIGHGMTLLPNVVLVVGVFQFKNRIFRRDPGWRRAVIFVMSIIVFIGIDLADVAGYFPTGGVDYAGIGVVGVIAIGTYTMFADGLLMATPFNRNDILESVDEGIVVVDDKLRIIDYNKQATNIVPELKGAFGNHIANRLPKDVEVAQSRDHFSGQVDAAVEGEQRSFVIESSPIVGEETAKLGHIIKFRDVTEVEEYAADLEHQREQLEELAHTLSHDLRNPLGVITMVHDLLYQQADLSDSMKEHLESAESAADRMDEIIDDALTLAEKGKAIEEEDLEVVKLSTIVDDSWATVDTEGATLQNNVSDDVELMCDPSRMQNLFENLFRNAFDHGGESMDTVRVEVTENGFTIEDNGQGLPEGDVGDLFEKGETTSEDGTGFGLSIVDTVVEGHGWEINADNGQLGGARFTVSGVVYES